MALCIDDDIGWWRPSPLPIAYNNSAFLQGNSVVPPLKLPDNRGESIKKADTNV